MFKVNIVLKKHFYIKIIWEVNGAIILNHCGELRDTVLIIKNTALDNRTALENETKIPGKTIKQIFWQTYINDQRSQLRIWINCIVIEGLLDTEETVTLITPGSLHPKSSGGR